MESTIIYLCQAFFHWFGGVNCRKMGYVPLPMLRTSVGFSAAFGSSTTGGLFTLVNEASFPHSWCIDLIAGIWQRL